jgi:hypothetical protein
MALATVIIDAQLFEKSQVGEPSLVDKGKRASLIALISLSPYAVSTKISSFA